MLARARLLERARAGRTRGTARWRRRGARRRNAKRARGEDGGAGRSGEEGNREWSQIHTNGEETCDAGRRYVRSAAERGSHGFFRFARNDRQGNGKRGLERVRCNVALDGP